MSAIDIDDKRSPRGPSSMLEVYMHAIDSPVGDNFLDKSNLGLGNYNTHEYWQQIQSFRNGLYADSAMTRRLLHRAIFETKRKMAIDAYEGKDIDFYAPEPDEIDITDDERDELADKLEIEPEDVQIVMDRQSYINDYADEIWNNLGSSTKSKEQVRAEMVHQYTGLGQDWVPPHWRMLKMRHEASRSKGARLIDNLFERVREVKNDAVDTMGLD